jgi:autotransporter passenger strand-loop-strand repeat protein
VVGGVWTVSSAGSDWNVDSGGTLALASGGLLVSTIVHSGGALDVLSGATASNTTVSRGGSLIVASGGHADPTRLLSGGAEVISSGGTDNGAQISGGTQAVFGVASGTTVFAGSQVVEKGGVASNAIIGNGIVDVLSGGTANIRFLSNGSGGLEIADTQNSTSAFTGAVSGFGGINHANRKQFIDLVSVTSGAGITSSYVSANAGNTSGALFVSSGGVTVASIEFIGAYSAGDFHITSGFGGTVAITDPGVFNGGSIQPDAGTAFPRNGIDLPNIAFGARTTLAYSENATGAGGTLTVSDGRHAATIALLGNYMAASFVMTADGHGGTLVTESPQPGQQPLLAHPQT